MRYPDYYGFRSQQRASRRRGGLRGSMRLGALFAVLVGINAYVFFFRGGTSIQDILKASAINKQKPAAAATRDPAGGSGKDPATPRTPVDDGSLVMEGSLKGHNGLSPALMAQKIDESEVTQLIADLRGHLDMRSLRPEHTFEVRLNPQSGEIRRFSFRLSQITSVVATRAPQGGFKVERKEKELKTRVVRIGGKVHSSVNEAMERLGVDAPMAARFVRLFSWDVNWYTDPRDGDEFRIVVQKRYLEGKPYGFGEILAAEYNGVGGRFQVFYHKSKDGKEGHYDRNGRSVRRDFLKTPLNFKRISSHFNKRRFHPVLHRTKGHFGVDYAADPGTPVWSVADGKVIKIGRYGGAGNMVVLAHKDGVTTEYMHLLRFRRGLKRGMKVRQGFVIGYVGSTGLATGPHLHYGVKVRGKHIDPLRLHSAKGELLPRAERYRFLDELADRRAALESIPAK